MQSIKTDFPFFTRHPETVYLDSAATTHKPQKVLDAMNNYYMDSNSNIDGNYTSSISSNTILLDSRNMIADFLGLRHDCVIVTPSATHSANMIAQGLESQLNNSSIVIVTEQEHHSNYLPFLRLAERSGARLIRIPVLGSGELDLEYLSNVLRQNPAGILALNHVSNVLGTQNPVEQICDLRDEHAPGLLIALDVSQSVAHLDLKVISNRVNYIFFSAHKIYGPQGIGILAGSAKSLQSLAPAIVGGKMLDELEDNKFTSKQLPFGLEPGTPNVAGVIGMVSGIEYYSKHSNDSLIPQLLARTQEKLQELGCVVLAEKAPKIGLLSFIHPDYSSGDIGIVLAKQNICVRSGTQCSLPLLRSMGKSEGVIRISFGVYTTLEDIDRLITGLSKALKLLS